MTPASDADVVRFYDTHPITAAQILAKVEATRGSLAGVRAEDLWPHDQDHYGGLDADAALADGASVDEGSVVLDLCAGLCGPARWLAATRGCRVLAVDLTESRVRGAAQLNTLTGLDRRISVLVGDASRPPVADASVDVVWSQEAFLHVPDKRALLANAHRALKPGGRLAFTDWIAGPGLSGDDAATMEQGIRARSVLTPDRWRALLADAGFRDVRQENLSPQWIPILQDRLRMFRRLREEARTADADPHRAYVEFYERFVALIERGDLGGMRVLAVR